MNWLAIIAAVLLWPAGHRRDAHRSRAWAQSFRHNRHPDRASIPEGYRRVRCPSCEETHLRPYTVRETPLRRTPRTDTIPIPRR